MSLFQKAKGAFKSAKCKVGMHGGNYSKMEGKPQCYLSQTCPDCFYVREMNCLKRSTCVHCDHAVEKIIHHYTFDRVDAGCNVFERCARCDLVKKTNSKKHTWGDWSVTAPGRSSRACVFCGEQDHKQIN